MFVTPGACKNAVCQRIGSSMRKPIARRRKKRPPNQKAEPVAACPMKDPISVASDPTVAEKNNATTCGSVMPKTFRF